ncbi:hypothetical protein [Anaerobium acetethylicum]|uniref:Uncharacterized protein n=1 Tax=Anaerobium acetethylicum TaxID=1619234 RepID=A0A1D3TWL0_9FIRM|nr:hypothetical protein [Anaerobium acetethylicum]SCP98604.1 hypothetical protein SAMN05421730_102320 [Anaerobium acetethylicum]
MVDPEDEYLSDNGSRLSANTFTYIIHEAGTAVYDRYGRYIGNFATEAEAVEMVREILKSYFDR